MRLSFANDRLKALPLDAKKAGVLLAALLHNLRTAKPLGSAVLWLALSRRSEQAASQLLAPDRGRKRQGHPTFTNKRFGTFISDAHKVCHCFRQNRHLPRSPAGHEVAVSSRSMTDHLKKRPRLPVMHFNCMSANAAEFCQ